MHAVKMIKKIINEIPSTQQTLMRMKQIMIYTKKS